MREIHVMLCPPVKRGKRGKTPPSGFHLGRVLLLVMYDVLCSVWIAPQLTEIMKKRQLPLGVQVTDPMEVINDHILPTGVMATRRTRSTLSLELEQ